MLPRLDLPARSRPSARLRRALLLLRLAFFDLGPRLRRSVDIAVAGLALALLSPLLLLVALAIKLSSRGPVLFPQERIGKNGRPFIMLKLRTMRVGADAEKARLCSDPGQGARFKMRGDPRITPIGRLLRKYSIDELPQLWNVLAGQMTLIGPRPPLRSEVLCYDARALRRLEVTQGLTCLWQVGGRSDLSFEEQVTLDVDYIDRASTLDELCILGKTLPAVLSARGAY